MSFINNLQRQRRNSAATPVHLPQRPVQDEVPAGLASTFRDPNRYNPPMNRQFSTPDPAIERQHLLRNYRG